jgi:hypothetical protein
MAEGVDQCPILRIPDFNGLILRSGSEPPAVGAPGYGLKKAAMAGEGTDQSPSFCIPDFNGVILRPESEPPAIGTKDHGINTTTMPGEGTDQRPCLGRRLRWHYRRCYRSGPGHRGRRGHHRCGPCTQIRHIEKLGVDRRYLCAAGSTAHVRLGLIEHVPDGEARLFQVVQ